MDWGILRQPRGYVGEDGRKRRVWAFVMVLGWSRALYVEFVRRVDVATFMQCPLGGVAPRCLYENARVVVLGRDEDGRPEWQRRVLDLSLRVGMQGPAGPVAGVKSEFRSRSCLSIPSHRSEFPSAGVGHALREGRRFSR